MLSGVLDPTCLTRGLELTSEMVPDTGTDGEVEAETEGML